MISHGRRYEINPFGVIVQTDAKLMEYNKTYVDVYNTTDYLKWADKLNGLRLGFVIGAHGNPFKSLLDIGYGNGSFMEFVADQYNCIVAGLDVTGIEVPGCQIVRKPVKADVVTLWDVVEHLRDLEFLHKLDCETLCVSVPFCHHISQGIEWFSNGYYHRKPDEHIRHFNEDSLTSTMSYYGWQCCALSNHEDIVRKPRKNLQNIISMAFKR